MTTVITLETLIGWVGVPAIIVVGIIWAFLHDLYGQFELLRANYNLNIGLNTFSHLLELINTLQRNECHVIIDYKNQDELYKFIQRNYVELTVFARLIHHDRRLYSQFKDFNNLMAKLQIIDIGKDYISTNHHERMFKVDHYSTIKLCNSDVENVTEKLKTILTITKSKEWDV